MIFSMMLNAFLLLTSFAITNSASAQMEFPEDKVSWKFSIVQDGDEATIIAKLTIEEHWHIYAANLPEGTFLLPTTIELGKSSKFKTVGKVIEPKPTYERDELADEDLYYHSNTVTLKRKIKVTSEDDFVLTGTFSYQTCDDTHCLQPYSTEFKVKVKGVEIEDEAIEGIEETFVKEENGIAQDKDGQSFVKVNDQWHAVPEGNSATFYKKYLALTGKDEE